MGNKSIKGNAIMNMILTISNMVFPLISFPYVARVLSVDAIGKVNFFNTLGTYALMFAGLGISTYGIRACAKVRDRKEQLSKVVKELLWIKAICTIVVVGMLLLSMIFVSKFNQEKLLFLLQIGLIVCGIINVEWLFGGLEEYSYITKRSVAFKLLSLVLLFLFVRNENDYYKYALILVFAACGNYFFNLWYSRRFIDYKKNVNLELRKHIRPTVTLFASILAVSVYTSLDTIMLGFMCGDESVGYYTVAVKVKSVLLAIVNSISTVLLPRLSYYVAEGKKSKYNELLQKAIITIMGIAIPLAVFFVMEAKDSILILGGEEYSNATAAMCVLMPILILSGFSNITGNQILLPHGKDSSFLKAVVAGAVVDLVLNIVLMPRWSYMGAAIATLIAEVTQVSLQIVFSRKYLKGNIHVKELIKVMLATAGASGVVFGIRSIMPLSEGLLRMFILAIIFGMIYWLLLNVLKESYLQDYQGQLLKLIKKQKD